MINCPPSLRAAGTDLKEGPVLLKYDFNGRAALVTGGTKGIGRSIANALLEAGASVLVTYARDTDAAEDFQNNLDSQIAEKTLVLRSDVSDPTETPRVFRKAEETFGFPLTMVVNNAGILHQGNFQELDEKSWDRTLKVNLKGPFLIGQELLRRGIAGSAIVNISSVGGQTGGPKAPDYSASKAGLISLTRSMARLGGPAGIRVNAVAPGWIITDIFTPEQLVELKEEANRLIPLQRLGTPDDVARSVLWLLSNESSYLTGHCLNINGGLYFG